MVALAESIRPVVVNSYHSSGREVLPPYVCADLAEPIVDVLRDIYRTPMDYDWRFASSSGESFEWNYNQTSSIAYLTEIGTAFQPPFDETVAEVERVRPGWLALLEAILAGPVVQGVVTDALTGAPLEASIRRHDPLHRGRAPRLDREQRAVRLVSSAGNALDDLHLAGLRTSHDRRGVELGGVEVDAALQPASGD